MENFDTAIQGMEKTAPLLITGAGGFIGRNLAAALRAQGFETLLLYDLSSPPDILREYAQAARFVFHLAGVNRPKENDEFYTGNAGFTQQLLAALTEADNPAPVLLSSTAQVGNGTDYSKSKEEAENAVFAYGEQTGAPVYVYRLPGVFGKWSRPNYNTVVATFCYNIARGLPIEVRDPGFTLPLCYIDDVVAGFIASMHTSAAPAQAKEETASQAPPASDDAPFFSVEPTYELTLGWLAGTIRSFAKARTTLGLPNLGDALTNKLWATYQSFLPEDGYAYPLKENRDERGGFAEFLRTREHGQVSINTTNPGVVRGNHWHSTKNEKFLVVSGEGVIRFRALEQSEIVEYRVSSDELQVVDIPPGVTHNIENTGATPLVTVMWASEPFDPETPDTFYEPV